MTQHVTCKRPETRLSSSPTYRHHFWSRPSSRIMPLEEPGAANLAHACRHVENWRLRTWLLHTLHSASILRVHSPPASRFWGCSANFFRAPRRPTLRKLPIAASTRCENNLKAPRPLELLSQVMDLTKWRRKRGRELLMRRCFTMLTRLFVGAIVCLEHLLFEFQHLFRASSDPKFELFE